MAHTQTTSQYPAALEIPELFENIIKRLPVHTIVRSRRVCRQWLERIDDSLPIKQALFLIPPNERPKHNEYPQGTINVCLDMVPNSALFRPARPGGPHKFIVSPLEPADENDKRLDMFLCDPPASRVHIFPFLYRLAPPTTARPAITEYSNMSIVGVVGGPRDDDDDGFTWDGIVTFFKNYARLQKGMGWQVDLHRSTVRFLEH